MPEVDRACKAVLEIVVRDGGVVVTRNGWDHWLFVVGEGGEACYAYLAERRYPNGARELLVNGLDLLSNTSEGNAVLLGAVESLMIEMPFR